MNREEAELMVMDRAKFTLSEHAEFTKTAGLPYSDDAIRAALAFLSTPEPRPEGVPEVLFVEHIGWPCYAHRKETPSTKYRYRYDGIVKGDG